MKRICQRWLVVLAAGLLCCGIGLNPLAYRHARAMMRFTPGNPRTQKPAKLSAGQKLKVLFCGVNIPRPQTTDGFAHNPVAYAAAVRCPILFLHGVDDPSAHLEEARRVFAAVPGLKRFQEFPGVGHESALARLASQWKETVAHSLKETETKPPAGSAEAVKSE